MNELTSHIEIPRNKFFFMIWHCASCGTGKLTDCFECISCGSGYMISSTMDMLNKLQKDGPDLLVDAADISGFDASLIQKWQERKSEGMWICDHCSITNVGRINCGRCGDLKTKDDFEFQEFEKEHRTKQHRNIKELAYNVMINFLDSNLKEYAKRSRVSGNESIHRSKAQPGRQSDSSMKYTHNQPKSGILAVISTNRYVQSACACLILGLGHHFFKPRPAEILIDGMSWERQITTDEAVREKEQVWAHDIERGRYDGTTDRGLPINLEILGIIGYSKTGNNIARLSKFCESRTETETYEEPEYHQRPVTTYVQTCSTNVGILECDERPETSIETYTTYVTKTREVDYEWCQRNSVYINLWKPSNKDYITSGEYPIKPYWSDMSFLEKSYNRQPRLGDEAESGRRENYQVSLLGSNNNRSFRKIPQSIYDQLQPGDICAAKRRIIGGIIASSIDPNNCSRSPN